MRRNAERRPRCLGRELGCRRGRDVDVERHAEPLRQLAQRGGRGLVGGTQGARRAVSKVSFLAAAETVLRDAARPLSTGEITEEALRRGLITTAGKTPEETMRARLYQAVRDHPDEPLTRVHEPREGRARRGSVRWMVTG